MKINVLFLGPDDKPQEELLIQVPSDMRVSGLIDALRQEGVLPSTDNADYRVLLDLPADRLVGDAKLQEMGTVIIKQRRPSIQILKRKKPGEE